MMSSNAVVAEIPTRGLKSTAEILQEGLCELRQGLSVLSRQLESVQEDLDLLVDDVRLNRHRHHGGDDDRSVRGTKETVVSYAYT